LQTLTKFVKNLLCFLLFSLTCVRFGLARLSSAVFLD
jgi:hypothetical protein